MKKSTTPLIGNAGSVVVQFEMCRTMASTRKLQYEGASRVSSARRSHKPLALVVCAASCVLGSRLQASELIIGRNAAQEIVASALFKDQGRWYISKGTCYAYLETPKVSLATGRLVMNAHLSSRVGLEVNDSCVGTGFASDVQLSGQFVGSGSRLTLQDIKIDSVKDDATRQALDLLQSAAGASLPRAVNIDLMQLLNPAIMPGTSIKVSVTGVAITDVKTQPENITVTFDIRLRAD